MFSDTINCFYCGGEISVGAQKCKHCGEWLNKDIFSNQKQSSSSTVKSSSVSELQQFRDEFKGNTLLMIGLFLVAGYIYVFFWFGERYRALNKLVSKIDPNHKVDLLTPNIMIPATIAVNVMVTLQGINNLYSGTELGSLI
ncbi:MAG: hypothetical protein ACD_20C00425G0001 [uncultured bacterium]|nr:MAG: hypothetical protein ACD_20C00425G0001 [uncultured bacterium]HBH18522.1 hypothetical protein [Cyanobacteria bacterium UBA9579]